MLKPFADHPFARISGAVALAVVLAVAVPTAAALAQQTGGAAAGATAAGPAGQETLRKATGTVKQVEARRLTLQDGTSYELAEGVAVQNIRPGEQVEVTYGMEHDQRVATDVGVVGAAASAGTSKKPSEAGQADTSGAGGGAAPKR